MSSLASEPDFPPGPRAPAVVQGARFGADPLGFFRGLERAYGDTFTLRLPGDPPRVVCSHPDDVKAIFSLRPEDFSHAETSIPLSLGRDSLLLLDGDRHARERKLIVPMLLGADLDTYAGVMQGAARRAIAGWRIGVPFRLDHALRDVALETIARCVFGVDGPRVDEAAALTKDWLDVAFSPQMFVAGMLLSSSRVRSKLDSVARDSPARSGHSTRGRVLPWQWVGDKKARLLHLLDQEIRAARARGDGAGRKDVLSKLVAARFEDGAGMSDEHVADELVTLLIGGQETTSIAMVWALYDILPRAEVLERATSEIDAELLQGEVDLARAGRLPYLEACIRESMRRRPVAIAVPRFLKRPLRLRKTTVPAGAFVWACSFLTHHDPAVFPEPDAFRPDRFLEGKPTGDEHYPFGGGRRRCAGMAFAAVEMRVVLAEILASAELELAPGATARPIMRGITLSPEDGVPVILRRRR